MYFPSYWFQLENVLSGTTNEDIIAGAAVQLVRASPASENVAAAVAAGQYVVVA